MKNEITDETMEYVGILAQLELTEEESRQAKTDMERMLHYFDKMEELDTTGVEPMSHVFQTSNCFREDVVTNGDNSSLVLQNGPVVKNRQYQVPKTI